MQEAVGVWFEHVSIIAASAPSRSRLGLASSRHAGGLNSIGPGKGQRQLLSIELAPELDLRRLSSELRNVGCEK